MSLRADVVLLVQRAPKPLTCREIAVMSGRDSPDVARDLHNLVAVGWLIRERSASSVYCYRVPAPASTPDLPRIHLQPGPLVPALGLSAAALPQHSR